MIHNLSTLNFQSDPQDPTVKYVSRKDEIGIMIGGIKVMRDNVANFVVNTKDMTHLVEAESNALSIDSKASIGYADELDKTIDEIAKGATEQAKDTERTADEMVQLGNLLALDAEYLTNLNTSAKHIQAEKEAGYTVLNNLKEITDKNNQAAALVHKIIMDNSMHAEKIEQASSMIANISTQTNLLALNASIEAVDAIIEQLNQNSVVMDTY